MYISWKGTGWQADLIRSPCCPAPCCSHVRACSRRLSLPFSPFTGGWGPGAEEHPATPGGCYSHYRQSKCLKFEIYSSCIFSSKITKSTQIVTENDIIFKSLNLDFYINVFKILYFLSNYYYFFLYINVKKNTI